MKKYRILYEDKDLLAVYKPAGVATQSARPTVPDLMSMLQNEMILRGGEDTAQAGEPAGPAGGGDPAGGEKS